MPSIIQQIADELNVSSASVSRALNDRPGVSEALRARILQRAYELNYTSNVIARGLATSQTFNLGFFVREKPGLSAYNDPFYGEILHGVEQISAQTDYHVSIGTLTDEILSVPQQFRFVREGRIDGMILAGPDISSDFILAMRQTGIPVVLVDNCLAHSRINCINSDDENGAYLAAQHLLEQGHYRVGIISGPESWPSNARRIRGYRRALENGSAAPIVHMDCTTIDSGKVAYHQLFAQHPDLTAICAVNDSMAIGAIHEALRNGRRTPDDVAIVGFDNIPETQIIRPRLTTIGQYPIEIGQNLGNILFDRLNGANGPRQVIELPCTLVERETT